MLYYTCSSPRGSICIRIHTYATVASLLKTCCTTRLAVQMLDSDRVWPANAKKFLTFQYVNVILVSMMGRGRQHTRISLMILAQAVEDVLRFELGLPLEGLDGSEQDEVYEEARVYIMRYPRLVERYRKLHNKKKEWLEEVQDARE